jgi:hypothetical protein
MPDVIEAVFAAAQENPEFAEVDTPPEDEKQAEIPALVPANEEAAPDEPVSGEETAKEAPQNNAPLEPAEPLTAGQMFIGMAALLAVAFAISLAAPFLEGTENLIGLLIIGFALWEAWRFNAYTPLVVSGPYQVGEHGQQPIVNTEIPQAPSDDVIL